MSCNVYGTADFGHGPVEVGCTQTGRHDVHKCEVILLPNPSVPKGRNVFEQVNEDTQ